MRFEVKDLIVKIETPEGHRVLGFDFGGGCARESGCDHGSGCRIFSGPCQISVCRKTDPDRLGLVRSEDRATVRAALLQALESLNEVDDQGGG